MKTALKTLTTVILFAIAMGFLESAVVIYLREIYYPEGFQFPLKPMRALLVRVELWRELATILMLIAIGYLAGKTKLQRFAYFCLSFATWDLFYYIFLHLFLGWPQSLFTWDLLFLIPLPWVGPIWAPCLLSLLMVTGAVFVIVQCAIRPDFKIPKRSWLILITGATICIVSFMWDYLSYGSGKWSWLFLSGDHSFEETLSYVPSSFNDPLFMIGLICMSIPLFQTIFDNLKIK